MWFYMFLGQTSDNDSDGDNYTAHSGLCSLSGLSGLSGLMG